MNHPPDPAGSAPIDILGVGSVAIDDLLAVADGRIIADASLHQQLGGWKRHIGRVSVLVHPDSSHCKAGSVGPSR